jgi:signal transduction histidine kinase
VQRREGVGALYESAYDAELAFDWKTAVGLFVFMSAVLVALFFLYKYLVYLVMAMFVLGSSSAIAQVRHAQARAKFVFSCLDADQFLVLARARTNLCCMLIGPIVRQAQALANYVLHIRARINLSVIFRLGPIFVSCLGLDQSVCEVWGRTD